MKDQALTILALLVSAAVAIPNPWAAPSPVYCVTDAEGTRCMPDKTKRTAAPMPIIEAREPKHHHSTTTTVPAIPNGCSEFVTNHQTLTRCEATIPQCNTYVGDDGISSTACILKRAADPQPTREARSAVPEPKPMYCVTDDQGTRCMPDRRAAATPEPTLRARLAEPEAEPMECVTDAQGTRCMPDRRAVATPKPEPVTTGWFTSDGAVCSVSKHLTRCLPNEPRCTTYYDHSTVSRWECVV